MDTNQQAERLAGAYADAIRHIDAGITVFSTAAPYILYTRGLARVESGKASIMASLEPAAAALVGILAFGEPLSPLSLTGILCVLAGVYILR